MPDLAHICRSYGAQLARLTPREGGEQEHRSRGSGLVAAVESYGVAPLAAALSPGERLVLVDTGVELDLERTQGGARLRVAWAGGPAYEEQLPEPRGERLPPDPGPAADAPAPEAGDAPVATTSPGEQAPPPPSLPASLGPTAVPVADLLAALHDPGRPLAVTPAGVFDAADAPGHPVIPAVSPTSLGSASFRSSHGVSASYIAGAMAGGIASVDLVASMGRAGLLGFYGAGGLGLSQVEAAVVELGQVLGDAPFGANLLHNPVEPHIEESTVDVYLRHRVRRASASAYMRLSPAVVRYRLAGISRRPDGSVHLPNSVFAKVSRTEVAEPFMRPAPEAMLRDFVSQGLLSEAQARMAAMVPIAEDITAEADSGGHTDHRPLPVLLPTLIALRDRVVAEQGYATQGRRVRVGAAGGLGDPASVAGAFAMGADYVLTGSINQSSLQADTSTMAKEMVAQVGMADVASGAAPDMFELGAHVQVVGRGSMYAQRSQRLHELYKSCAGMDEIPTKEREKLERSVFQRPLEEVWEETRAYWASRDPREVEKAATDPRHRMALTFRWYLGMSSRWARMGEASRKRDFQIWCGPSMGRFNDWVRGTWLEPLGARDAVVIARTLLHGAAALQRVSMAAALGVALPPGAWTPPPTLGGQAGSE